MCGTIERELNVKIYRRHFHTENVFYSNNSRINVFICNISDRKSSVPETEASSSFSGK